jgi:hypothetical protein
MDLVADRAPPLERRVVQPEILRAPDAPVEGRPGHHLREGEVTPATPHLPDALVGLAPERFEARQHRLLQRPSLGYLLQTASPRLVEQQHDLAEHVELELCGRGVADPDWAGLLEARKPRDLPFKQPALAGHPEHDLHLVDAAGHGPDEPVAPRLGLLQVAAAHERI